MVSSTLYRSYETATVSGWRSYLLILIVTVNPKICNVIVIGICFTPFRVV